MGEVESLRTEDTKHFRMSDGSFSAVSYGIPVHYQDEDGNWKDINNVPVMTMSAAGDDIYRIVNAESSIAFATTLAKGWLLTASYEDMSVSMTLLDPAQALAMSEQVQTAAVSEKYESFVFNRNVIAKVECNDMSVMTLSTATDVNASIPEDDFMPNSFRSSVLYENVYPGVDIRYTAWGYRLKEEIIVKTLQNSYYYDFYLALEDLFPTENTDGSISLLASDNREIYRIPAPYMIDASGAVSELVSYDMTPVEGGLILTVQADPNWIESSSREFPVVIDPSISTSQLDVYHTASDDIYTTYIHPAYPNDTSANYDNFMYTGYNRNYPTMPYISYLYFNQIPEVPVGCVVADVKLRMFFCGHSNNACSAFPLGVYPVTIPDLENQSIFDWFKSINYNSKPEHCTENVVDFLNMTPGGIPQFVTWDITKLAKGWYEDKSNLDSRMVALAPVDLFNPSSSAWQYFMADGAYSVPVIIVNYRSTYGLEDYHTYQTIDVGEAGTAYVADSTGYLKVVKNLATFASDASPFMLNLVYNSDYFANTDAEHLPPTEMGLNMKLGCGWTLDCIQTAVNQLIGNTGYVIHTDGDGTVHYYKQIMDYSSGTAVGSQNFEDEDGLNLTMTIVGSNSYRQTDKFGNYNFFDNQILTDIVDWDGNAICIKYTNKRITSITRKNDGIGEVTLATFGYDVVNTNLLTTITDIAGNIYTLEYTDGNLTSIQKNGRRYAQFTYSGRRLIGMIDCESSYSLNFRYDTSGRVSGYEEIVDTIAGAAVSISYPGQGQTVYRNMGMDGTLGNCDDLLYHYLTDYTGRTINVYVTDSVLESVGNIYGASNAAYGTSGNTKNHVLRSASIGVAAQQLLQDVSTENNSWMFSGTSVSTDRPRTGLKCIAGSAMDSTTTQYAQHPSNALTAGEIYTFSAYVYTHGMSHFNKGIFLKVTDSTGQSWSSDPLNYATSEDIDGGWARISVSFKAQTSGIHTLSIHREGVQGTFYADDFQLEKGEAPSAHNLLENGSMMSSCGWTVLNDSGVSIAADVLTAEGSAIRVDPVAYQDILINLPGSQTYVLSGWGKADTAPDTQTIASNTAQDTYKQFGLRAVLTYSDGTTEYHYVPFDTDVTTWQFTSLAIVPGYSTKTVTKIRVICAFEQNIGTAQFDNISLIREVAQSMHYNENGLLVSVVSTGLASDMNTYNGVRLTSTKTAGNGTYYFGYNDTTNTRKITSITHNGVTQYNEHNAMGNLKNATLTTSSSSKRIISSNAYDSNGDRLISSTDAAGNTVTYAYGTLNSQMLGLPTAVTTPNGTTTFTNYDSQNRVAQTGIANVVDLQYTYDKGNLKAISRTDNSGITQSYNMSYDSFGNILSTKVGTRTLASYEYANRTGYLTQQTDGNSHTITYSYDHLGRVKTATYSEGLVLIYVYTGSGELYSITAMKDGAATEYIYTYDSVGRLVSSERKDDGEMVIRTRRSYDSGDRLASQSWQFTAVADTNSYTETFAYRDADGRLASHTNGLGQTLTMGYDYMNRLSTVAGGIYGKSYTYRDISSTKTTMQVASLTYDLPTNQIFSYTYDNMGNIATYTDANGTVTYTYDAQGQLLSAADGTTTYSYTYDTVGNILTANGHTYTYGDVDWKDLLTAYDGEAITYDAIGNPLSYCNGTRWTFTWVQGRRLASASDGTDSISYTYNADGVRTSKTVNGTKHTYYYASGKLLRETYGSNTLDFFYSTSGQPYALKYNGTVYYYITNLQGDVMSIVDGSGAVAASYKYDPYGNIISATGDLAEINPLRYRGYYYDTETTLYYLQSRYYDPKIGRFLNADAFVSTGQGILGNNMFAYCRNNPVVRIDITGTLDVDSNDESDELLGNNNNDWTNGGKLLNGNATTSLYRSVGANEMRSIKTNNKFIVTDRSMQAKQFSFSYNEAVKFGKFVGQNYIVKVRIPTEQIYLFDQTEVDRIIFRHGTLTVHKELLPIFNQLIVGAIEFFSVEE